MKSATNAPRSVAPAGRHEEFAIRLRQLLGLLLVGGAFRIISITEGQSALVRMKTFLIEDLIITRWEPNRPQLACQIGRLKKMDSDILVFPA